MEQKDNSHKAAGRAHGLIWEPNYNDRILLRKGQLQRWLSYLDDNPRRLLLKRQHPEYFTQLSPIPVLNTSYRTFAERLPSLLQASASLSEGLR